MYYVYVIRSESSNKIYIAQTRDLIIRVDQHNDPNNDFSKFTKQNKGPWNLVYKEEFATRKEALIREKYLKSSRGRYYLKKFLGSSVVRPKRRTEGGYRNDNEIPG